MLFFYFLPVFYVFCGHIVLVGAAIVGLCHVVVIVLRRGFVVSVGACFHGVFRELVFYLPFNGKSACDIRSFARRFAVFCRVALFCCFLGFCSDGFMLSFIYVSWRGRFGFAVCERFTACGVACVCFLIRRSCSYACPAIAVCGIVGPLS